MTVKTQLSADQDKGTITASTSNFSLKSEVGEDGSENDTIRGFLATTHVDKGNDEFTEDALRNMADDINEGQQEVDAVFRDVDTKELAEATTGNLDHDTNPAAPFGDTRTVPAFKLDRAEVKDTPDGEQGLWVKATLNSDGMLPATVSAVKNSIKDGFLDSFSIEFVPKTVERVKRGNKIIRIIKDAAAKGAALTGRPMNPGAQVMDSVMKSVAAEYKVEYAFAVGDEVSWNDASGVVRDRTKDSCFNEEIDGDFEVCGTEEDPAYLIEVDNDEETIVAHKQSLFTESGKAQHEEEMKQSIQTPEYTATSEGSWSKPAESDFPDDYNTLSIFLVRRDSDNFSDQSLPVVDYRDGEPTLVLEGLRSAHQTASRVDGLSEEEVGRARSKAEELASEEFDEELGGDNKNDITPMTDEQVEEGEQPDEESGEGDETKSEDNEIESLSEDVKELKSQFEDVKSTNEELREENEELKSELQDLKTLEGLKSDLDEVKGLIDDIELEDGPRARQEQKRFEGDDENQAEWKNSADKMSESYFDDEENLKTFAQIKGIKKQEVKNYVNTD